MTRNSLLTRGYRECARLTWRHGTTYFWGAALLPRRQRKHVYAVYALCRLADDIVDVPSTTSRPSTGSGLDPGEGQVAQALESFADRFRTALIERGSDDPVTAAVVHTVIECGIEPECFDRFFGAMAMDLTTSSAALLDAPMI